jgi:spore germination protein GerM
VAGKKKTPAYGFGWLLFWLAFLIVIILLFVINRERVQNSLSVLKNLLNNTESSQPAPDEGTEEPVAPPAIQPTRPVDTGERSPDQRGTGSEAESTQKPTPPAQVQTVKRQVYLIRLDSDGALVAAKVERSLPSSESPMKDALETVIKGPSADEAKRNLLSLIPANVKILGATIQGSTAYINFSEEFLFNTYGIEGYAGQLRQVVWTATEFGTVKDVQILIDGKRVDYLGEGIWIGSPINRDSL